MRLVRTLLAVAVAVVVSGGAAAQARKPDVRTRITQQLDKALKVVKATKEQRVQVQRIMGDVLRLADDMFGGPNGFMPETDEILAVFAGDKIDERVVRGIMARRDARHHRLGDALERAFAEAHGLLSVEQRRKLAEHGRGTVSGPHMRAFKEKIVDGFVNAAVEDVLDQLAASQPERTAAHQARDKVLEAIKAARDTRAASAEELGRIFVGDPLDKAALATFRTAREAQLHGLGEQFATVITELHASLSPAHRKQVVELVRARAARRNAEPVGESPL